MAPSQTAASTSGNRMTHSLSTPSGVDGSSLTINRGSKKLAIRVQMLDDSITLFQVQVSRKYFYPIFMNYSILCTKPVHSIIAFHKFSFIQLN